MIKLRKMQEEDIPELADLFVAVFNAPPWSESWTREWALERLTFIFKSYRFYGCLAEEGDQPVAAAFSRLGSYKGALELEIIENFVVQGQQRKGLGGKVLDELKRYAKPDGVACFVLQTDRHTYAKDFYLKYGFVPHEDNLLMSHEF